MSLENLYGRGLVVAEAKIVGGTLAKIATAKTSHPDDRDNWTEENPTYGHCDLFTQVCTIIWARNVSGKPLWNEEACRLCWWVYQNYDTFCDGVVKNKLDVHYSLKHPIYGYFDLSRNQFKDGTYLHPRPKPLSHQMPVSRSWDKSCEIPQRKRMLGEVLIPALLNENFPAKITPELEMFLEGIARGETFGLM